MKHNIITRYGIRNSNPDWYEVRQRFFEMIYLPSLLAQTNKEFTVYLLVDKSMPERARRLLEASLPDERFIVTEKLPELGMSITTRLDSDDAIATTFVEKVQKLIKPESVLNFTNGYILKLEEQEFHFKKYPSNMFVSTLSERNAYFANHDKMYNEFKVIEVPGYPMWVHIWHKDAKTAHKRFRLFDAPPVDIDYDRFPAFRSLPYLVP